MHAGEVPVAYVTLAAGAEVTEEELLAWAAAHVPERAAAPKAVTVLDALPVTAVGKPYKLALRADATRRAVAEALLPLGDGIDVECLIEDGSVFALVTVGPGSDQTAVKAALDRYAIRWDLAVVDDGVETAELAGLLGDFADLVESGEVAGEDALPSVGAVRASQTSPVADVDDHVVPVVGQRVRRVASEAAGCPGHQNQCHTGHHPSVEGMDPHVRRTAGAWC